MNQHKLKNPKENTFNKRISCLKNNFKFMSTNLTLSTNLHNKIIPFHKETKTIQIPSVYKLKRLIDSNNSLNTFN